MRTPLCVCRSQQLFVLSLLTLLRTHLSVVASVGPDSVHMACGPFIKPLRHLLFKMVDSQLPPALDKVSEKLSVIRQLTGYLTF